jgi:hypothetical protein
LVVSWYNASVFGIVAIILLAGVVLGSIVWSVPLSPLFKYPLLLAIAVGDIIAVAKVLFSGGRK